MGNLNLSEDIQTYIDLNFIHDKKIELYQVIGLLDKFGNKFYEDRLIEIIVRDDTLDSASKQDLFLIQLRKELIDILYTHGIHLDEDNTVTFNELLNIADTLYLIQNLEDYRYIKYIVFSNMESKDILGELVEYLTIMSSYRFSELVEAVDDSLIHSIRLLIEDKEDTEETLDQKHREYIKDFFAFIDHTDCLGIKYHFLGYINLTIDELVNSIDLDIPTYVETNIVTNKAQVALDLLSLLIITNDLYEVPLLKFKKKAYLFINAIEHKPVLEKIMSQIMADFSLYLEAKKEGERHG